MRRSIWRLTAPAIVPPNLDWARGDARPDKSAIFYLNSTHHGFQVHAVTPIPDLRLTMYKFVHEGTGSVVYHIDNNDQNNAFCIGFGTPATSSRGTTHVLEHTVLCGSDKYPVKDPFFHMLRRSLSTFMNAMTGADYTLYPFATVNPQDFQNLLDVYLDAVFMPQLRQDDFRQEGHRLEPVLEEREVPAVLNDKGEEIKPAEKHTVVKELKYNGVVFNEMLGVVSEPSRHFMQELQANMLPGTHYEHLSGGDPPEVLNLTHKELVQYHRRHYSPSNSVAFVYGDLDPRPALQAVGHYYTQLHQRSAHGTGDTDDDLISTVGGERVPIPSLQQFKDAPWSHETTGPSSVMGDPAQQSKAIVSYALPPPPGRERMDRDTFVKLSVLEALLTDGPAAPMYRKLISEGQLGSSFAPMSGFAHFYSTPLLSFGVDHMDKAKTTAADVEAAVVDCLKTTAREGFDPRRVESTVFQSELSQRHRGASYGVNACIGLSAIAITNQADPAEFLNWLPTLREIANSPEQLQKMIDDLLAGNSHRMTMAVHADPEHSSKIEKKIADRLAIKNKEHADSVKVDPTVDERLRVDHEEWLRRVNRPNETDLLPSLTVRDIPPKALAEPPMRMVHDGVELIATEANGLVYVNFMIPQRPELYDPARLDAAHPLYHSTMLSPVLTSLVAGLGSKAHDFEEFDVVSQLVASGIGFGGSLAQRSEAEDEFIAGTTCGFYTTSDRLVRALDLVKQLLLEPRLAADMTAKDRQYLQTNLVDRAARKADGLQRNGHRIAAMQSYASVSYAASLGDHFAGLTQAQFLDKLKSRLTGDAADAALDEVLAARDERILDLPRRAHDLGADVWAVCDDANAEAVALALRDFRQAISGNTKVVNATPRSLSIDRTQRSAPEGVQTTELPINASYAASTYTHGLSYMSKEQQALRLGLQLVKSEFLHREVRELGGAYGVMTEATLNGITGGIAFSSYRDPTPERSIETFAKVGAWLSDSANVTQARLNEAKLRLFAGLDHPITCDTFGAKRRVNGLTPEGEQHIRDTLLAITPADVIAAASVGFAEANARSAVLAPKKATGTAEQGDAQE